MSSSRLLSACPLIYLSALRRLRLRARHIACRLVAPRELLVLVTEGQARVLRNGQRFEAGHGRWLYLREGDEAEVQVESRLVEGYWFELGGVAPAQGDGGREPSYSRPELPFAPGLLAAPASPATRERVRRLYASVSSSAAVPPWDAQLQFQALLLALLAEERDVRPDPEAEGGIERTVRYMHRHYRDKLRLETLAHLAGLTETSYSRSFKRHHGVSPKDYLNRVRLEQSRAMLEESRLVKEVSERVGFGSEFYFSRLFKREFGLSPAVYARRRELTVGVANSFGYGDNLRALGLEPHVCMNGGRGVEQSEEEHVRSVRQQLDALRQAQPDLIIADCRHQPYVEQLRQIAPVVTVPFTIDWRQLHRRLAELVGREREAEQNIMQVEQKIDYALRMLGSLQGGRSIAFLRLYSRKIRIQGIRQHPMNELLYTELGLKPGSSVPLNEQYREFDADQVPPFETDRLLIDDTHVDEASFVARLQQTAYWRHMHAVRADRVCLVSNWIKKSWSPLGRQQIIDELLRLEFGVGRTLPG